MENLILVSKDDLFDLFKEIIEQMRDDEPKENEKDYLSFNEGLEFINEKGLSISESTLYKLTSEKKIPFQRWGGRKIVFVRNELNEWVSERLLGKRNVIANNVAAAARKKERA